MKECSGISRDIYACALFPSSKFFSVNSNIIYLRLFKKVLNDVIISFSNVHLYLIFFYFYYFSIFIIFIIIMNYYYRYYYYDHNYHHFTYFFFSLLLIFYMYLPAAIHSISVILY